MGNLFFSQLLNQVGFGRDLADLGIRVSLRTTASLASARVSSLWLVCLVTWLS